MSSILHGRSLSLFLRTAGFAAIVFLACVSPSSSAPGVKTPLPPPPLRAGVRAPEFHVTSLNGGKAFSRESLRGKVVLIDYWATWCSSCPITIPLLERLHRRYARQGLVVLGISVDEPETQTKVKPFVRHFGATYPVAVMTQTDKKAAARFHVEDLPSQYLIDKHGIVRWSQAGDVPDDGLALVRQIRHLLAEKN